MNHLGDTVAIQNQHGNNPLRWNRTGIIVEKRPHRQYRILVDGSGRTTLRNRKLLRRITNDTRTTDNTPISRGEPTHMQN